MNELINYKQIWKKAVDKWRNSFGSVLLVVVAFLLGMVYQNKLIVDDCKFSNVFRDGSISYNCQMRAR
jgi:hypothetical protein